MSAYNPTISDPELRDLFRAALLEGDDSHALRETFIDMEQQMVFAAETVFALPLVKEKELFAKLHGSLGTKTAASAAKFGMKWLFTGLGGACVATGLIVYTQLQPQKPQPSKAIAITVLPAQKDTLQPDPTDSLAQAPAVSTPVTEQTPLSPDVPAATENRETAAGGFFPRLPVMPPMPPMPKMPPAPPLSMIPAYPPLPPQEPPGSIALTAGDTLSDTVFTNVERIEVALDFSDIRVTPSADGNVTLGGGTVRPAIERHGATLKIASPQQQKKKLTLRRKNDPDTGSEVLILKVPAGTQLILQTANGDISVEGMRGGECDAQCDFGDISIKDCHMKTTVMAASGQTELDLIEGSVTAVSDFGDVRFSHITGSITAQVSSGTVRANDLHGATTINSDFGDLIVDNAEGDITLQVSSGNATLDSIRAGSCVIVSNFGNTTLTNVNAKTKLISSSGNVMAQRLTGDLDIESSFGNITLADITGTMTVNGNSGNMALKNLNGNLHVDSQFGDVQLSGSKGNAYLAVNSGSIETKDMELTDSLTVTVDFGNGRIGLKNKGTDLSFNVESSFGTVKINKGDLKLEKENGIIVTGAGRIPVKGYASSGNLTFN